MARSASKDTERVGSIDVPVSHLGKPFFPGDDLAKGDLVDYYRRTADRILPYVKDRPLVMERYPDGIDGERIVQKNVPGYFPDWIRRRLSCTCSSAASTPWTSPTRSSSTSTRLARRGSATRAVTRDGSGVSWRMNLASPPM